ncbi:MAG: orotidine-5'-phosphate decarboxylase, partial [Candidatus Poribacteria bacterium]|nr:orotidine-5'-phosphate decarboxylase [Candidatus Poribacteria bacterium]
MTKDKLIVALDFDSLEKANQLVATLSETVKWFKIGKQLFTATGPASVNQLVGAERQVFLDLKFHDIPNTVAGAVASATKIGANMINMHASGGFEMMRVAREAAEKKSAELDIPKPTLLGVTVLTSIDEVSFQRDFGTQRKLKDQVAYFAELSQKAGLDGVVASPLEVELIRQVCGEDFGIVTPGVRPEWAASNDQRRVMTPAEA